MPEATGDYAGLVFEDRDALVAYMRENLGEGLITMHHAAPRPRSRSTATRRPRGGTSRTR